MDDLYRQLGFDKVRQRIASSCATEKAEQKALSMESFLDSGLRDLEQALLAEMKDLILREGALGFREFRDPGNILKRLAPAGSVLSEAEVHVLLLYIIESRSYSERFRKSKDIYPRLHALTENGMPDLRELSGPLAKAFDDEGRLRDTASRKLAELRARIRTLRNRVQEKAARLAQQAVEDNISEPGQVAFRNGRLVIPVRASRKSAIPGIIHDQSQSGQTLYIEPMVILEMNNELRQTEMQEQDEIYRILGTFCDSLRTRYQDVESTIRCYHDLDLLHAKGTFSADFRCEMPVRDSGGLYIKQGRNVELQMKRDLVPLDMNIPPEFKGVIITGPNAGGKTVTLKTVGLMVLMDRAGLLVPADLADLPEYDRILVDIGDGQSIDGDLSTYSSHISRLKQIMEEAGPRSLVLMDELGTGTDPDEGEALAEAVLEYLLERDVTVIATTHHSALKSFAYDHPKLMNGSMSFNDRTLAPGYEFRGGIPGSSYAVEIARRYRLPESVLEFASRRIGKGREKLEKLITDLQRKITRYDTDLKALKQNEADLKQKLRHVEKQKKEIDAKYKKADKEALKKAQGFIAGMYREFEETIKELRAGQADTRSIKKSRDRLGTIQNDVEERLDRLEAPEPGSLSIKDLKQGDPVYVKSMGLNGVIREVNIRQKKIWVDVDGRRLKLDVSWLAPAEKVERQVSASVIHSREASYRLDLRGKRVEEALAETDAFLDAAVLSGLGTVEILHGKGDGILKKAISEILPSDPRVSDFQSAPVEHGGAGITVVSLRI